MCVFCNPLCGICSPPKMIASTCGECGAHSMFDKDRVLAREGLVCPSCGAELGSQVAVEPVPCNKTLLVCAWPCGCSTRIYPKAPLTCPRHTPAVEGSPAQQAACPGSRAGDLACRNDIASDDSDNSEPDSFRGSGNALELGFH